MERWLDLRSTVLEGGLMKISSYSRKRLYQATGLWFGRPVTGYLLGARIAARSAFGRVFAHEKADRFGRFANGHRIITSDIVRAEKLNDFWVLRTKSGSLYVLVTFDAAGGRRSLDAFFSLDPAVLQFTPAWLH